MMFISRMDDRDIERLKKIIVKKYGKKIESPDVYNFYNIKSTFLLGAVVLESRKGAEAPPEHKATARRYIENFNTPEPALVTEISKIISAL